MRTPAVRFRVDFGRHEAVGPGKIALLEHIAASGSLSQAARELKMSYRRAWQLLESLNGSFSERVAVTSKGGRGGGGASLTPLGAELVSQYRAFDRDVQRRAGRYFQELAAKSRARSTAGAAPVRRLSER